MNRPMRLFLEDQYREARTFANTYPLLDLAVPVPDPGDPLRLNWTDIAESEAAPYSRYLVALHGKGLVRDPDGSIVEHAGFFVKVRFPDHYLRHTSTFEVLTWAGPDNIHHPNVFSGAREGRFYQHICIGHLTPGTGLVRILVQLHNVIRYWNFTTREQDSLNPEACAWARNNAERFPVDERQLVWLPEDLGLEGAS